MDITSYLLGKKAGGGGSTPTLQTKSVTITENGTQNVTPDSGYDGLSSVGISANVQPDLETKSVTITENTTTEILPSLNKDGLSSVSVTTNVPRGIMPTGTIEITQNGTTDVTNYASANVNVSGGADLSEYFNTEMTENPSSSDRFSNKIIKKIPTIHISSNVTSLSYGFEYLSNYKGVLKITGGENVVDFSYAFQQCGPIGEIDMTELDTNVLTNCQYMFYYCNFMTQLDLSKFSLGGNNISSMFKNCVRLTKLDIRSFDFSNITNFSDAFTSVPAGCLIIVADDTQKTWLNTNFSRLTNVKTVAEYEASQA